ncbi:MAG: hypothetical protein H7X92_12145 [Chitinophagales bacterium]|nr:hypothetical protein [Hyphomicrobiales bacterium]
MTDNNSGMGDGAIATSLISAPAWAPWLNEVNQLLTTASLGVGLVLGAGRLWLFVRERQQRRER